MQKVAIIGAGNVGGQIAAFLIREDGISDILLLDTLASIAKGKALDLEDAASVLRKSFNIEGSDDFSLLKDASIIVVTAGLARRPGMSRDDLLAKNSEIIKDVSMKIKKYAVNPVIIVVTNPVDLLTYLVSKVTGFKKNRVFGMGVSLDSARMANLIRRKLGVEISKIETLVLGSHGQTMVPILSLTKVQGREIKKLLQEDDIKKLAKDTIERGASIVGHLGSGSAYLGPAQAVCDIIRAIIYDEKRLIGSCCYLSGEYGVKDLYLGAPAKIGKDGVEEIVGLELSSEEKEAFLKSADSIRKLSIEVHKNNR